MRFVAIALLVLLAATSFAGQNPNIRCFVSLVPHDYAFSATPATNSIQNTYLCLDCLGAGVGITAVSLALDYRCGGFVAGAADVTMFDPGAWTEAGGPDDLTGGWTICAPDCVLPDEIGIVVVAMIPWFYTGPPGDIVVLPNPVSGRKEAVDCNGDVDLFCVYSNAALGQAVSTPGDSDCDCAWFTQVCGVYCEPQGGYNPVHPPTYWYWVYPAEAAGPQAYIYGFHIQVFDPIESDYSNWIEPSTWTHMIQEVDGETWVTWCGDGCLSFPTQFGFDNANPAAWGEWMVRSSESPCVPEWGGGVGASWDDDHNWREDGYGRRVHVPSASASGTDETSWGTIKALYR